MFSSGKRWFGVAIGVLLSAGPAYAADITGPYVGVAAGGTGADFDAASRVYASTLSGTNDENLLIFRDAPGLAAAYATNILSVYGQYRWRFRITSQPVAKKRCTAQFGPWTSLSEAGNAPFSGGAGRTSNSAQRGSAASPIPATASR